jgi:hypothetical protein
MMIKNVFFLALCFANINISTGMDLDSEKENKIPNNEIPHEIIAGIKQEKAYKILVVGRPQKQGGVINKQVIECMINKLEEQNHYQNDNQEIYKYSEEEARHILTKTQYQKETRNALIWVKDKIGTYIYEKNVIDILKNIKNNTTENAKILISFVDPWPKNRIPEKPWGRENIHYIGDFPMTLEGLSESHALDETYDLVFVDFHTMDYLDMKEKGFANIKSLLKKDGILFLPSNGQSLKMNFEETMTPLAAINAGSLENGIENLLTFTQDNHKKIYKNYQGGGFNEVALKDGYYIFQK